MPIELYLGGKLEHLTIPERQTPELMLARQERPESSQAVPDPWDVPTSRQ
jgi:hypothetical protein